MSNPEKVYSEALKWDKGAYTHKEQDKFNRDVSEERKKEGIDCSELMEFSFYPVYPNIPDGARNQFCWSLIMEKSGLFKEVSKSEALNLKGCLAFYFTGDNPTVESDDTYSDISEKTGFSVPHVAMTVGDGTRVFHAINGKMGVDHSSCWTPFTRFFDPFPKERGAQAPQKGAEC